MINSIKENTVSKADTKKKINELNEIKKAEKSKRLIKNQEKLLSVFDNLKTVFNINENENVNVNESESENVNENENESENENEHKSDDGQYYLENIKYTDTLIN